MVNTESLQKLHDIWLKYVNSSDAKDSIRQQFRKATRKVVHDHYTPADDKHEAVAPLSWSFGMLAMGLYHVANHHIRQFWSTGVVDSKDLPTNPICNPLFVYTSIAGDKFVVNYSTTPLAIFHLATAVTELETGDRLGRPSIVRTNEAIE